MAVLVTDDNIGGILNCVRAYPIWVLDLETTGLNPRLDKICGWALKGWDPAGNARTEDYYIPVGHRQGNVDDSVQPQLIKDAEQKVMLGWNNAGFDTAFMWSAGMKRDVTVIDAMLEYHLLNENDRYPGLKSTATKYYRKDAADSERELMKLLEANLLPDKGEMFRLPPDKVAPYAGDDVELTLGLHEFFLPHIERQGLQSVCRGVAEYGLTISAAIQRGMLLDFDVMTEARKNAHAEMMRLTQEAWDTHKFKNLNSAQKVCEWLGIKSSVKGILETLVDSDPRVQLIRDYRGYQAAVGSYYTKWMQLAEDHVLHPSLLIHGTISGRLSCKEPNAQSMPTDTKRFKVKKAVIARPGYSLIVADLQQVEMCLAVHHGREDNMRDIILGGGRIHQIVADELEIPYAAAKRTNFSVIYGVGGRGLAQGLGVDDSVAEGYLRKYHRRYPGFRRLLEACERFAERKGYIRLYTGRRRHYNAGPAKSPTHKACSNFIQGTVAEIFREAQTRLDYELRPFDCHQLLQVHDSAVMECPADAVQRVVPMVREIMEIPDKYSVPIKVDITSGPNLEEQAVA